MSANYTNNTNKNRSSFTLIELLVVLALVAILSVVVVLTLNPAELIKQARDSNRLSDLSTINTALNLFSADVTSGFMGTSTVVYVSIPSASPTCSGLGLPALPSAYTYNCVTTANLRNTDGTGWIPVNFQRISSNSPISQLPIDPINTTSTRLYYTYVSGGSWELNASIEAAKNKLGGSGDLVSKDGGSATSQYEIGNNLNLSPIETGDSSLVGYWNFEEGPNATSTDRSGYGNHGTWYGTSTAQQHYAAGKVGNYGGWFNGNGDFTTHTNISFGPSFTWTGWFKADSWAATSQDIIAAMTTHELKLYVSGSDLFVCSIKNASSVYKQAIMQTVSAGQYYFFSFVYDGSADSLLCTIDSLSIGTQAIGGLLPMDGDYLSLATAGTYKGTAYNFNGILDDIRIYNRALSAAEVLALYNSTK